MGGRESSVGSPPEKFGYLVHKMPIQSIVLGSSTNTDKNKHKKVTRSKATDSLLYGHGTYTFFCVQNVLH